MINNSSIKKEILDTLLPHTDNMSLLSEVAHWDKECIHCIADSHMDANNPLAANNTLAPINGIEYAAQAMAIHRTLIAKQHNDNEQPMAGFLATASKVTIDCEALDSFRGNIDIKATCLSHSEGGSIYEFSLSHEDNTLVAGQALVALAGPKISN